MNSPKCYVGIAVSEGVVYGHALLHNYEQSNIPHRHLQEKLLSEEVLRFKEALRQARRDILLIQERLALSMGKIEARLFDAHLLLLEDPTFLNDIIYFLQKEHCNIEYALFSVAKNACSTLRATKNPYLRERALDIEDITRRILRHLLGKEESFPQGAQKHIILSSELTPSHVALLFHDGVAAFITEMGSKTSHTAILARALNIPAIVGVKNLLTEIKDDTPLLIDGTKGTLITYPSQDQIEEHQQIAHQRNALKKEIAAKSALETPKKEKSKPYPSILANIELVSQVDEIKGLGVEGVGLYRSEFFYFNRTSLPTEEEQYQVFKTVAEKMSPHPVTIRTCDLGADKLIPYTSQLTAANEESYPFLGARGIRFCLKNKPLFKTQLRALLRASVLGNIQIMYPMISGVKEILQANEVLAECQEELLTEGIPFSSKLPVGMMIETPSAVMVADHLAEHADFFSIGTNDLIQYLLAIDRGNEAVSYLYNPAHPAVLRSLKMVIKAAHHAHIPVAICGEIASDISLLPLLLGLGVDQLSVAPQLFLKIKKALEVLNGKDCCSLVNELLEGKQANNNYQHCLEKARAFYGENLEPLITI